MAARRLAYPYGKLATCFRPLSDSLIGVSSWYYWVDGEVGQGFHRLGFYTLHSDHQGSVTSQISRHNCFYCLRYLFTFDSDLTFQLRHILSSNTSLPGEDTPPFARERHSESLRDSLKPTISSNKKSPASPNSEPLVMDAPRQSRQACVGPKLVIQAHSVRMYVPNISPIMNEEGLTFGQNSGAGMYITESGSYHAPTADICKNATLWKPSIKRSAGLDPNTMMAATQVQPQNEQSRSFNLTIAANVTPWEDQTQHEMMPFSVTPSLIHIAAATYCASSSNAPDVPAIKHEQILTRSDNLCTSFSVCLQSLEALHNVSRPQIPPFVLVLSLNRKAVKGCVAILFCSRCMSEPNTHTAAMLFAIVFGEIMRLYENASDTYFENNMVPTVNQVSSGHQLRISPTATRKIAYIPPSKIFIAGPRGDGG
ncbi:hypothetical protein LZ30DRAFT_774825 [Colletotrichum cereale]|nr:hypothetical protein LZ30DRAFT_774825 [Colletotrichum cereale]